MGVILQATFIDNLFCVSLPNQFFCGSGWRDATAGRGEARRVLRVTCSGGLLSRGEGLAGDGGGGGGGGVDFQEFLYSAFLATPLQVVGY